MAMKIDVGVCKKIGLPDYGSAGSHCNITLEADISVLNDPDEFQRRVRHAYGLCRQAVENELSSCKSSEHRERVNGNGAAAPSAVQRAMLAKLDASARNENTRYLASEKQLKFIGQLCRGIKGLDNRRLDAYCQEEFGKSSKQLSAQDASKLIDMLKDAKDKGGLA